MTDVIELPKAKRFFTQARDLTATARAESQIDDDYFHGYQLTAEERRVLQNRLQPDTVFNRVRPAVLGTLGVLKQGATDPRAYPRTPKDEESADVATKTLQYCADKDDFDATRIDCALTYLKEGSCAVLVGVNEERNVTVEKLAWEEFFYDPRSRRADFGDARYMGQAKWAYADDVAAAYPDKKDDIDGLVTGITPDETFQDRPRDSAANWVDERQRRIMLVEMYYREGAEWFHCVFVGSTMLLAEKSPWVDRKGKTLCGIEAQSCFIDRENNRYGIIRDMRGPQDEFNKRRIKLLHMLNTRQLQVTEQGYEVEKDYASAEAAKPNGVIPFGYQVIPQTDMASGQFQLLGEAAGEMERMGPNPAVLGRQGENSSGRAQLVRQQAGLTELAVVFGGVEAWELRVYRAMWARVQQFWTGPMFVRVTDDENAAQFVAINEPQHGPPTVGQHPETGMPMIYRPVLGYKNQIAEMDVDITLDTVPDTANLQQEQFQTLAELAKLYGPQEVPFEDMLLLSSIPDKSKIIEKRKARAEEAQQGQGPQQQLALMGAQSEIENTQADTELKRAQAQVQQSKAVIEGYQAGYQLAGTPAAGG
jgi:hypothetical protein